MNEYVVQSIVGKSESVVPSLPTVTIFRVKEKNAEELNSTKIIKKIDLTFFDSHSIDTLTKSVRSTIKLNHENIIKIFNFKVSTNKLLILMEDAGPDSRTLQDFINESGRIQNDVVISIFTQLISAVKYLHDRKIVHRNIRPDNILIIKKDDDKHITVKLSGFTSARSLDKTKEDMLTYNSENIQYLAPEIQDGILPYTNSVDIWSLGCVLYELCTNKHCFMPRVSNYLQIAYSSNKPNVSSSRPTWLRDLIKNMLSIAPNKRPTATEILKIDAVKREFELLYGGGAYEAEMCHTVFHGTAAGETPEGMKKTIKLI